MCVCIPTLVFQDANHIFSVPYYIVICGLSGSTIFSTPPNIQHEYFVKKKVVVIIIVIVIVTIIIIIIITKLAAF